METVKILGPFASIRPAVWQSRMMHTCVGLVIDNKKARGALLCDVAAVVGRFIAKSSATKYQCIVTGFLRDLCQTGQSVRGRRVRMGTANGVKIVLWYRERVGDNQF